MTLADLRSGVPAHVTRVDVDVRARRRLAELGLRLGATVEVVARTAGGGRVVALGSGRVALDLDTARQVAVGVVGTVQP